jgi:hypothetical protein
MPPLQNLPLCSSTAVSPSLAAWRPGWRWAGWTCWTEPARMSEDLKDNTYFNKNVQYSPLSKYSKKFPTGFRVSTWSSDELIRRESIQIQAEVPRTIHFFTNIYPMIQSFL